MFDIRKVFGKKTIEKQIITKDEIAELLKISPEALEAFEKEYEKAALSQDEENFFAINSRQATKNLPKNIHEQLDITEKLAELKSRVVNELLAQTDVFCFDGKSVRVSTKKSLPDDFKAVTNDEICSLPKELRPQLTGDLMMRDIKDPAYIILLDLYSRYLNETDVKKKQQAYNLFRQGLDIQDLDSITYEIIGANPNSMGHWFPQLVEANKGHDFFKIPATTIAKVPLTLLQLTRQEYMGLTQTTLDIVDKWAYKAFGLDENKEYFIKTGTYSSKYDFRNCHVHDPKEIRELGEYLLFIHFQALQMASPLCSPCIYGVSTTNEWVVREFITDKENNPKIYKGLSLHTEYRVFVDCDTDQVIGIAPYWEPNTMKQRFGHSEDSDSPHQIHDYVIYKAHEETLMQRYYDNKDMVIEQVEKILPDLDLKGQWSLDIMQNGEEFWLIDMALAENSAFYDKYVPKKLRNPSEENWIPRISEK